jgi:hypothetical protein
MSADNERCKRCGNLDEILLDGYCERCCDALGRHRPTIHQQPKLEPAEEKSFQIVETQ